MKNIKIKNYFYVILLVTVTIVLSLLLSKIYLNRNKSYSQLYKYSSSISVNEFSEYISENPDAIIYISNKYCTKYEAFEKKFIKQLENRNLKSKIVFVNIDEINYEFIKYLNENFEFDIELKEQSTLIVFIDGKIDDYIVVNSNTDATNMINYEVFE